MALPLGPSSTPLIDDSPPPPDSLPPSDSPPPPDVVSAPPPDVLSPPPPVDAPPPAPLISAPVLATPPLPPIDTSPPAPSILPPELPSPPPIDAPPPPAPPLPPALPPPEPPSPSPSSDLLPVPPLVPSPPPPISPSPPSSTPLPPIPSPSSPTPPSPPASPPPPAASVSPSPPSGPSPHVSHQPPRSNSKTPSASQILSPPPASSQMSTTVVVGVALGSVAALLAVFGLLWLLFCRRNRRRDPYGMEGYYKAGDSFYGSSGQSGHQSNLPSAEYFSKTKSSSPTVAALPSMSNSTGLSSIPRQPPSTNGSGGFWTNSSGPENSQPPSSQGISLGSGTTAFSYEELNIATNGFSSVNLLGQGGFGYVHKGMLPNGKIVAVKSLKADSGQGEREFQAEVETISRVHHKHLVSLAGYCITNSQKLLVYEFVQNKTLEFHLHGKGQAPMDWPTRLKIAVGAAKGLAYLHEDCHPKIIHRDIKGANILLDFTFEAKVADFGLAKFSLDADTHISTRVMGTFGYMAPEYASTGKLTEKSDVFSFGVLLLEMITGRRPVDYTNPQMEDSLVDWARPLLAQALQDGNFDSLVDPRLENNYIFAEMGCMITCAASCVRHSAKRRPRMSQVVRALEGNLILSDLNDGVKPGFSSFRGSSDIDNNSSYKDDMQRFKKMVFPSEDFTSSEFGATHSEYSGGA